ncbi:hypothetical protein OSSY52_20660 [Tepiditoga spiralis]|uniref:Uncharacterized protein n=1 Tax=Tepiditoga spiralis TaxID=2108365 RepID=A0A7G1G6V5_9BACT|nr:hypothetical protein OSSY52_20660 [Tepiditoga spiralis]
MKTKKTLMEEGNFKKLFSEYNKNKELKEDINKFREGYYGYRRNDCGDCLQCIGSIACADSLCECMGGDLCSCF